MAHRAGIILAAGEGKRMKSALPKVMHNVAGLPILGHVIAAIRGAGVDRIVVVVTSPAGSAVRDYAASLGAGTSFRSSNWVPDTRPRCGASSRKVRWHGRWCVYGDMPLVTAACSSDGCDARPRRDGDHHVELQQQKRAAASSRRTGSSIALSNTATRTRRTPRAPLQCRNPGGGGEGVLRWAAKLENKNDQHEFYLTDVPNFARRDGVRCGVVDIAEGLAIGVNSRAELAACEAVMQRRLRARTLDNAAGMIAPDLFSFRTIPCWSRTVRSARMWCSGQVSLSGAALRSDPHAR